MAPTLLRALSAAGGGAPARVATSAEPLAAFPCDSVLRMRARRWQLITGVLLLLGLGFICGIAGLSRGAATVVVAVVTTPLVLVAARKGVARRYGPP